MTCAKTIAEILRYRSRSISRQRQLQPSNSKSLIGFGNETDLQDQRLNQIYENDPKTFLVFEKSISENYISNPAKYEQKEQVPWNGACLDTGAQKSVIGLNQAMAYCKYKGVKFKPKPNGNKYRFGADKQESLGSIPIIFPSREGNLISM